MAGARWDRPLLAELSQVMRDASICGLGQAAPNAFDCVIEYFPDELGSDVAPVDFGALSLSRERERE
jgi:NADH:ubiquinone oxidoreductase subunit F (NADH-binding)